MNIGKSVRVALAQHDKRQIDLQEQLGVSQSYISRVCNGKAQAPERMIKNMAESFDMKVSEFIALGE